jgi:hypothetical protein
MKVLICGSRNWSNHESIERFLRDLPVGTTVIHGGCRGADSIAGDIATSLGMSVVVFHANWANEGRAAGPKRNKRMLEEGAPDLVVAFHESIGSSRGTKDMINKAKNAGIETKVITE